MNGMDVISTYTRAEAIADGVLVDVSDMAREYGFRYPVAMTNGAWSDAVAWTAADNARKGALQDERGRLADVLTMLHYTIQHRPPVGAGDRVAFSVLRVPRAGTGVVARAVAFEGVCGPGDAGEPVITIQLPGED